MTDEINISFGQSFEAESGSWYKALQRLGRGGNATTWLMVATGGPHRGIPFAVKFFRKLSAPDRKESFLSEMTFLEECDHPGILRIFDTGVFYGEHPFIVMEYMPRTLSDVIRSNSPRLVEKVSFICQLCSSLRFLANLERPIIHRDIKPANIFVKANAVVLGDFGLMKRVDELPETDRQQVLKDSIGPGMPFRYRTPDLVAYARNEAIPDCRSDIYQLGLVAAELFTGWNPQQRVERDRMLDPVVCDPVQQIRGARGSLIRSYIENMIADDREQRPSTNLLLDRWLGVFDAIAETQHGLEGTVF